MLARCQSALRPSCVRLRHCARDRGAPWRLRPRAAERIHTTRPSHLRNISTLLCDKSGYLDGEPSFHRAPHSRGRCAWKSSCPLCHQKVGSEQEESSRSQDMPYNSNLRRIVPALHPSRPQVRTAERRRVIKVCICCDFCRRDCALDAATAFLRQERNEP